MNTNKNVSALILGIIFAVVMVAVLVCHFLPFWAVDGQTASLMDISARQYGDRLVVINGLADQFEGFSHFDINTQVLLTIVCSAMAAFMAFTGKRGWLTAILGVVCLGFGLWLYLTVPAFAMGKMCYVILGIEAIGAVLGVVTTLMAQKK